jgi:serine/threonine-protein kinase
MTDPSLEREAIALFERWLDIPESERAAWLAERTAGRAELRSRVEAMAEADRLSQLRTGAAVDQVEEAPPPERIGAYRIVERIGRGGMGAVYRGERITGDFRHAVAIKIVKPGLLSEALVERFGRERQILAQLSHPNIARLYDGGETESGSPYIIMELVDGQPVLEWADARGLGIEARRRLYLDICGAVGFAHRNLIVHRDLTPSNVLVTADGVIKVIDFGIAKPADGEGGKDGSSRPSLASLTLTPGYAAPERMTSAAVTTAADVYSLGKLLQKLIPQAGADRELQAVVARATATLPEDRYATVDALAADVDAWGRGFPVSAAASGRGYVLRKFVGRHRGAVAASAAGVALLLGAFGLTVQAYARAEQARQAEAARFDDLRRLARFTLFDLNGRLERVAGNTSARAAVAAEAQRYLSGLARSAADDPELQQEAAQGFIALAYVQGVPGQPNLGQSEPARRNLQAALDILNGLERSAATINPDRAQALTGLAMISAHTDSALPKAEAQAKEAKALLGMIPEPQRTPGWRLARSRVRNLELELAVLGNRPADLLTLAAALERDLEAWPEPLRSSRQAELDRASADYYRGVHGYFTDALEEAHASGLRAEARLTTLDRALPNDPMVLFTLAWNSYITASSMTGLPGREAEGRRLLELARITAERLLAIEETDNAVRNFVGQIRLAESQQLSAEGRHAEALAAQRAVIGYWEQALGSDRPASRVNRLATAQVALSKVAMQAGDRPLACDSFGRARELIAELEGRRELVGSVGSYRGPLDRNLGLCASGAPLTAMAVFK